jgi:hypothetical protein
MHYFLFFLLGKDARNRGTRDGFVYVDEITYEKDTT